MKTPQNDIGLIGLLKITNTIIVVVVGGRAVMAQTSQCDIQSTPCTSDNRRSRSSSQDEGAMNTQQQWCPRELDVCAKTKVRLETIVGTDASVYSGMCSVFGRHGFGQSVQLPVNQAIFSTS